MSADPLSKTELNRHKDEHQRLKHELKKRKPSNIPKRAENEEMEYEFYLPGRFIPSKKNSSVLQKEIIRFRCMKSSPKKHLSVFDATNEFIRLNAGNRKILSNSGLQKSMQMICWFLVLLTFFNFC